MRKQALSEALKDVLSIDFTDQSITIPDFPSNVILQANLNINPLNLFHIFLCILHYEFISTCTNINAKAKISIIEDQNDLQEKKKD